MEDKTKQWRDLEEYFATEVIEQSKRTAKRWFAIWLITFIALVATNTVWIYVFNSYEYVQQDGNGESEVNMEYPKPVMKMGELVKMGFPRSFLDEAYRERGQDFAQKGAKKNSPIFFDTELFEKWRVRKLANENQAMQRGGV